MRKAQKRQNVSSIQGLARLMQGEFLGVHGRLDGVDRQFESVQKKMDTEFAAVHKRIDGLEAVVREMKENAAELFTKLDEFISLYRDTKQELAVLAKQVKRLEERILQLEVKK